MTKTCKYSIDDLIGLQSFKVLVEAISESGSGDSDALLFIAKNSWYYNNCFTL